MALVHVRERELTTEVAHEVGAALPEVEVLAVEITGPERLCVYIDHPDGVTLDLCEQVTNVLRGYLDRWTLDVSSPGLERPLRTREHFARALGRRAALRTTEAVAGRTRFRGEVVAAGETAVTLAAPNGERLDVPYAAIARGNLIDEGR
jgi:ribosome maturation factor RimP